MMLIFKRTHRASSGCRTTRLRQTELRRQVGSAACQSPTGHKALPRPPHRAAEPTRLRLALSTPALLALCLLTAAPLSAQSGNDPRLATIQAELAGPIEVLLSNGNRQVGRVAEWDGETLQLDVDLGVGSAQMSFEAEAIHAIAFPGRQYLPVLSRWMRDPARTDDALEVFRAYYRQQGAFFQFLDASELNLFVEYIRFAIEKDKPLRAVAMIEVLRPHIEDPLRLKALDESILLAFFRAGMLEQAADQAAAWVESAPPAGSSALGWRILAEIQFRNEAYEDALWTALYPIAFANQILPEHLDACYAFAIAAADETRQRELKARLSREMRERSLTWPSAIEGLQAYEPPPPPEPSIGPDGQPDPEPEPEPEPEEDLLQPIQTPSPLDPLESLPTRILRRDEGGNLPVRHSSWSDGGRPE